MVDAVRDVEKALGKVDCSMNDNKKNSRLLRRSLFVIKYIKAGEKFTEENVRSIIPGYGLSPRYFSEIINRKATTDIARGTPLS